MKRIVAALLLVPALAWAWQPPAGKPVTATVGFAPGSGNEVSFRIVSSIAEKTNNMGNTFVIPGVARQLCDAICRGITQLDDC